MITQKRLKELLKYNKHDGMFYWTGKNNRCAGTVAGSIHSQGYIRICIDRKSYSAHRLAVLYMTGSLPPNDMQVDHINHVRDDNKWSNLRVVTPKENNHNRRDYIARRRLEKERSLKFIIERLRHYGIQFKIFEK